MYRLILCLCFFTTGAVIAWANDLAISPSPVQQGLDISPVPTAKLNLAGQGSRQSSIGQRPISAKRSLQSSATLEEFGNE
jgi:hypothetical protein